MSLPEIAATRYVSPLREGGSPGERFGLLVAPASTIVQPGPVHTGLCEDPAPTLENLFAKLVLPAASPA